jgi:hypothetical protein
MSFVPITTITIRPGEIGVIERFTLYVTAASTMPPPVTGKRRAQWKDELQTHRKRSARAAGNRRAR